MAKRRNLRDGSKGKAMCANCRGVVPITFEFMTVGSSKGFSQVPMLAGVCNNCWMIVSIPHQSVVQIKKSCEVYRKLKSGKISKS